MRQLQSAEVRASLFLSCSAGIFSLIIWLDGLDPAAAFQSSEVYVELGAGVIDALVTVAWREIA